MTTRIYCSDIDEEIDAEVEFEGDGVIVRIPEQSVKAGAWARERLLRQMEEEA
jgi:hypothetical protein